MSLISRPSISKSETNRLAWHKKNDRQSKPSFEPENVKQVARKVRDYTNPTYKKGNKFVAEVAKKEGRVLKYATSSPKVKHSRNLPWRL